MKKVFGNTSGLKATQLNAIETLYRCKIPPESVAPAQLLETLCRLSHDIRRQIGILAERSGKISHVVIGDHKSIMLPDTSDYPAPPGRLKGLRYVHTHLKEEPLTQDDLTDLTLLRLDLIAAITLKNDGTPGLLHPATVSPDPFSSTPCRIYPPMEPGGTDIHFLELVKSIEAELSRKTALHDVDSGVERALLISVTAFSRKNQAAASLTELSELARSSDIQVLDTVIQFRKKIDPRFLIGTGKLEELSILAMRQGATLIIFDQELSPSQVKAVTDRMDIKVIDRTQLILDIFARRAKTSEGKLQVELAQLQYMLPRLIQRDTALSRLAGGIGGRGPGETRLEMDRRKIRNRIAHIEKALEQVKKQRHLQKSRREKKGLPVISIIGYTNAGKSTLLNTLTKSQVLAENRLFATLDPSSRRIRFPRDIEAIITDTVGFIKDLPKELRVSFGATLEELASADLLLHVVDSSNPDCPSQIESVRKILEDLDLGGIETIHALNKMDMADPDALSGLMAETGGIPVSANKASTLLPLVDKITAFIENAAPRRTPKP